MEIIDYSVLIDGVTKKSPFHWGMQTNLIRKDAQSILAKEFPLNGFVSASRSMGQGKHYRFEVMNIVEKNDFKQSFETLTKTWQKFICELISHEYLTELQQFLGVDFAKCTVDIGLFKFNTHDWVDVHVDRHDKILTQLFYFNDDWQEDWGGELYLLAEPSLSFTLQKVQPTVDQSAFIVRSDNAWHYVSPVNEKAKHPRLSLQVEIIKNEIN